jgi:solute carrier family 36 (proton-coupled amino acid transporter)
MKEPRKFPMALTGVIAFLTCMDLFLFLRIGVSTDKPSVLFGGAGMLAYFAFGSEVQTVILVNLDTKNKMVQSVSLKITPVFFDTYF